VLYAAYGSNLHPARLRVRVPSAELLGKAVAAGRRLAFHKRGRDGSGKATLIDARGSVHVAVYDIAAGHKTRLDRFEGTGYGIETLELAGYGECFVYVAHESHVDESLRPFSWYTELVIAGCRYLEFPDSYVESIAAVEALEDPDAERHRRELGVLARIEQPSRTAGIRSGASRVRAPPRSN
jgi:gamma-glutamylcyclotransferase